MNTLLNLLSNGKTQFHAVKECIDILSQHGYKLIDKDSLSSIKENEKYMVSPYSSMLIAFSAGNNINNLRIASAHTDFPMLKIKPQPDINKKGYMEINIEPYGGLIKESWFDRPLGIAGKLVLKSENAFSPKSILYDSQKPICIIPNLAPHLSRGSKQNEMDIQKEFLPIIGIIKNKKEPLDEFTLLSYIAKELSISIDDVLDYDLYLYNSQKPETLGIQGELLTAPRIDNLSSVAAILKALCNYTSNNSLCVGAFFDNEEIGSRSKQGADSLLLRDILERIIPDKNLLYNAFNLSVDVAHATHPNYVEKSDITNDITLGDGLVIKSSASQRYVTDSEAGATVVSLCLDNNIKYIRQANRSGSPGGQTLGPIMSSYLPLKSADIGIPMLAMHSASELICISDYYELCKLIQAYYSYI